jgi:tRNA threonylcarbamoyladenosine biosynthesis protein TsaB
MKTLLLETSTDNCSVGLAEGGELLTVLEQSGKKQHSALLNVFIQKALEQVDWQAQDVERVAVGQGPGSYTGLRIGVSTAKAYCYALDIPLVGLSSLAILSQQLIKGVIDREGVLCPMLDARRMEVYTALYDREGNPLTTVQALVLNDENLRWLFENNQPIHVAGEGAAKAEAYLKSWEGVKYHALQYPSASGMAKLAHERFEKGETVDVATFEPVYLKAVAAGKPVKLQHFLNK